MRILKWARLAAIACGLFLAVAPAAAASLTGNWNGTYECGNKTYQLRLRLVQEKRQVYGLFIFVAPDGTNGAFRIQGWHSMVGEIRFNPGEWVDQPAGYTSVALFGETKGDNRLIGGVDYQGCGGFHADRE